MSDTDSPELYLWKILGKKWTLPILKSMGLKETMRYGEIKKALTGVSSTMLSERLLDLEKEGLIMKKVYGSKVEYGLTGSARELEFMLEKLDRWWSAHRRGCQPLIAN
jgi:DNA-binding HxlR family transcriptional regulator